MLPLQNFFQVTSLWRLFFSFSGIQKYEKECQNTKMRQFWSSIKYIFIALHSHFHFSLQTREKCLSHVELSFPRFLCHENESTNLFSSHIFSREWIHFHYNLFCAGYNLTSVESKWTSYCLHCTLHIEYILISIWIQLYHFSSKSSVHFGYILLLFTRQ